MPGATFEQVQKGTALMADQMKTAHGEAQGLASSFGNLLASLIPLKTGLEGFKAVFGDVGSRLKIINQGLSFSAHELEIMREQHRLQIGEDRLEGRLTAAQAIESLRVHEMGAGMHQKQLQIAREVEVVGARQLATAKALLLVLSTMYMRNREYNQSLIEANSLNTTRFKLMYDTLFTQVQIGSSFSETTHAAKALTYWGLESHKNFQGLLRTVMMLQDGIGMSVQLSAELAAVVERRLGGNFEQVADTMAQLVNDTALTADEAGRLAINLSRVMETVKPGMGATALSDISKLVGGYESAIKRMGGQAGMVEQWLSRMTTPEGLLAAGALGVQSPEFIKTKVGVEQVMQNFRGYAEGLLQNAEGWDRRWRLEALGQQMGLSADQTALLLKAVQGQGAETSKEISLRKRYQQQTAAMGEGIVKLAGSFMGLLQGALYPLIWGVNQVIGVINSAVDWALKYKEVAIAGMVVVGTAVVSLVGSMHRLALALWDVFLASKAVQISAAMQARAQGASAFTGAVAGVSGLYQLPARTAGAATATVLTGGFKSAALAAGRFLLIGLKAVFAPLWGVLGIGLVVIAGLLGAMYWQYRKMVKAQEEERMSRERLLEFNQRMLQRTTRVVGARMLEGDVGEWQTKAGFELLIGRLSKRISSIREQDYFKALSLEDQKKEIERVTQDVANAAYQGAYQHARWAPGKVTRETATEKEKEVFKLWESIRDELKGIRGKVMDEVVKDADDKKLKDAQDKLRGVNWIPNVGYRPAG